MQKLEKKFWAKYWLSGATWEASSHSFEEAHFVVLLQHFWTVFNLADQYKPLLLLTAVFTLNGFYTDVNCLQFITLDYSSSWKMTHMSCLICAGPQSNFLLDFSLVCTRESCWVCPLLWPAVYCDLLTWVSLILFWMLAHWQTSPRCLEKIDKNKQINKIKYPLAYIQYYLKYSFIPAAAVTTSGNFLANVKAARLKTETVKLLYSPLHL